jgi:hypothetical protein
VRSDALDEFVHGRFELGFGDQASDQPEFQGAFGSNSFSSQNDFKGALWADEERKDGGGERRKHADGDFRLGEAGFRRGDYKIAECSKFGTAADGRTVYDAEDRLADFEHSGEGGLESFEHLVDALRSVLANVDATAKNLASGIKDDELDFVVLTGKYDAVGNFAEHGFIEEIVVGTVEGEACDAGIDAKSHEFETFRFATRRSGGELLWRSRFGHVVIS